MGIGVFGRQLEGLLQRVFYLAAKALRQRLGHADALPVAAQRIGLAVPGIGIFRVRGLVRLGARGYFHEQIELGFFLALKVGGIDAGGLVRHRDAVAPSLQACFGGFLEFTVVKQHPGLQHGGVFGQRFAVAQVQAGPVLFQAGGVKSVVASVWKSGPFGHVCCLLC